MFGPTDPTTQLIQLSQTKHIRTVNDHGVGVGHINARFNNVGRQQQIKLAIGKVGHHLFKVTCTHLTMGNIKLDFRNKRFEFLGNTRKLIDPWANIKHLPATMALAQNCLTDNHRIVRCDVCPHGKTVYRRCRNDRQFLNPGQSELQGARDRCSRQGQNVDVRFKLFQTFFMFNAKVLFFIDDQKTKVFEMNTIAKQSMRAADDINMSAFKVVLDQLGGFTGHKTRQLLNTHREPVKAFLEVQVMLTAQQCCRGDDGNLFA